MRCKTMKYTREEARIKATQKAWEYRHYGKHAKKEIPSFEEDAGRNQKV